MELGNGVEGNGIEVLEMKDVLRFFWFLPNNQKRLDFLLDKIDCPDAVLKAMLDHEQFVVFLFRNSQVINAIEKRLSGIDGLPQMAYAKILPVAANIMAMKKKLVGCCEGKVVEEVQLSIGSQILNLILEVHFYAADFSMIVLDENVVLENDQTLYVQDDNANEIAEIMEVGDPEIPGKLGLYLINRGRREPANQYLKIAVDLGAKKYQFAYAANLFVLASGNWNYLNSCLQAWKNIVVLNPRAYPQLIELLASNLELACRCLENLLPYFLMKLLMELENSKMESDDIRQKLAVEIRDLLMLHNHRQLNNSSLPN